MGIGNNARIIGRFLVLFPECLSLGTRFEIAEASCESSTIVAEDVATSVPLSSVPLSSVPLLLSKLHCPQPVEIGRKRKVAINPTPCDK